jgi:DnaJ-class molecular chaperone
MVGKANKKVATYMENNKTVVECSECGGLGYHFYFDEMGEELRDTCISCHGSGKVVESTDNTKNVKS